MISNAYITSKQKQIRYSTTDWTIKRLIDGILSEEINVPTTTTHFWDITTQSRVIETIILGLPLPSLFVQNNPLKLLEINSTTSLAKTLVHFVGNHFSLSNITQITSLTGFRFLDLYPQRQQTFLKTLMRVVLVDKQSDIALFDNS